MVSVEVKFTICIPTLNAAGIWREFWDALRVQTLQPSEILVIDSSSNDGTRGLARRAGCRVVKLPKRDFRHGGTRQFAAEIAGDVDILVYLTQDSILANGMALKALIAAFENSEIGAAYGRQLPRPDSNPIAAHARLFNYPATSSVRSLESISRMGFKSIFFSNSFGAYRRKALMKVRGFPSALNFGEDTIVAARLLQSGWKIAYRADAHTFHAHNYSFREEYDRARAVGELHKVESWLLREFGKATTEGRKFVLSELNFLLRSTPWLIPESLLRTGLKYAGYNFGRRLKSRADVANIPRRPPEFAESALEEKKVS